MSSKIEKLDEKQADSQAKKDGGGIHVRTDEDEDEPQEQDTEDSSDTLKEDEEISPAVISVKTHTSSQDALLEAPVKECPPCPSESLVLPLILSILVVILLVLLVVSTVFACKWR